MRIRKSLVLLTVAVIMGLAGVYGAYKVVQNKVAMASKATPIATSVPVVVASRDIKPGDKISLADLKLQPWPSENLPGSYYTSTTELIDRVALKAIIRGEVILNKRLAPKGRQGGLSAVITEGMRAISVKVDEVIGVAGYIQPGDKVDVIMATNRAMYSKNPTAGVIIQDIRVLAVGEHVEKYVDPLVSQMKTGNQDKQQQSVRITPQKVTVATLEVNTDQAKRLTLAASQGRLLLSLRSQGYQMVKLEKPVAMSNLLDQRLPIKPVASGKASRTEPVVIYQKAVPVKAKKTPYKMEIIRGTKVTNQRIGG